VSPSEEALLGALSERGRHFTYLSKAMSDISDIEPMDARKIDNLSDQEVRVVDQFIFRFTYLQDALGQKVFKYLLEALREPLGESVTFIDKVRVLEKLQVLDADEWENTRVIRNRLVHEYPDAGKRLEILHAAMEIAPWLGAVLGRVEQLSQDKLGLQPSLH